MTTEAPARDREFFRQDVLRLLKPTDTNGMRRAVVIGYLRGTVRVRTAEEHAAATLGALDALDESTQLKVSP